MNKPDVIVVGGGLAGLSCAIELLESGKTVRLLEARPQLGGRTSSWVQDGMSVESGLHRYLGFYSALPRLLKKAGIDPEAILIWEDELEIRLPDGLAAVYAVAPLHRPLQMLRSFLGNNHFLPWREKVQIAGFVVTGLYRYFSDPEGLDRLTVLDLAKQCRLSQEAMERFLIPLTAGVFFIPPERYSAYDLFGLLGPYLPRLYRMRLGAFRGGMTDVMCDPLAAYIEKKGGEVRRNAQVEELIIEEGRVVGVKTGSEQLMANHVVLAASLGPAQDLIKQSFADHPWFQQMLSLATMPAVTIQFELRKPAMPVDHTTFGPTTALASFAEQSRTTFKRASSGRFSAILTPPEEFLDQKPEKIAEAAARASARLGLPIADTIERYRVVTEPRDFYLLAPGSEALRPLQKTEVPGLILAGDYTKQRYLSTMEGAVESGRLAARAVLDS